MLSREGGDFEQARARVCLWDGQVEPCIHQNHVFRVRPLPGKLNSRILYQHYLQSARAKHYFLRMREEDDKPCEHQSDTIEGSSRPNISIEDQERFELQIQIAGECSAADGSKLFSDLAQSLSAHAFSGQLTTDWRTAHADKLAIEARERDAALKQAGATISHSRRATIQEMDRIFEQRTDGIYSDLNREQRDLLFRIHQRVGGVHYARYFSAQSLSGSLEGSLHKNPQAIEGYLAVFAARGLIIPVSREEQTEDTGEFVFGNAYRLPLKDRKQVMLRRKAWPSRGRGRNRKGYRLNRRSFSFARTGTHRRSTGKGTRPDMRLRYLHLPRCGPLDRHSRGLWSGRLDRQNAQPAPQRLAQLRGGRERQRQVFAAAGAVSNLPRAQKPHKFRLCH